MYKIVYATASASQRDQQGRAVNRECRSRKVAFLGGPGFGSPAWIRTTIKLTIVESVSYVKTDLTLLTGLINRRAFVHNLYARKPAVPDK